MITVYLATLLVVIVLATALLGLVAMVAAADRGGDNTRLGRTLRTMLAHLNGEARPPAIFTAFFAPVTDVLETRQARKQTAAAQTDAAPPSVTIKVQRRVEATDTRVVDTQSVAKHDQAVPEVADTTPTANAA